MKNLKILLILSLTITLFSCKSDDSVVVASANADLLGTWTMTALTGTIAGNKVDSSGPTTTPFTSSITGSAFTSVVTFTENPNVVTSTGTYTFTKVVSPTGGTVDTDVDAGQKFVDNNPATWTRVGSLLTIVDGAKTKATTMTISGTTMTLSFSEPISDVDGTSTTTGTQDLTATFTKM